MADDVFAIKELREIILSFPPSTRAHKTLNVELPILLNAASGEALWLADGLRKRILNELQNARQRLVLSTFAQRLDVGSKDLLSLLGEPDIRPLWCYNSGIHSIVPPKELAELLQLLGQTASEEFVELHQFCKDHDLHATDLRHIIPRSNVLKPEREQLGIGRWYDENGTATKGLEYVYTNGLLASTRNSVRERLHQATEARKSVALKLDVFSGLDQASARCFLHKSLESLYDYNHDYIQETSLAKQSGNEIIFTPATAAAAEKEEVVRYFLERVEWWLSSGEPASDTMPCLPLQADVERQQTSVDAIFAESAEIVKSIAPGEKLIRIGDYGVTYRELRTLADHVLATIEESLPIRLDPPRAVKIRHGEFFRNKLYEIITTDFSSDSERIVSVDCYVALGTSLDAVKEQTRHTIASEAQTAWEAHAQNPESVPFPDTIQTDAILALAPRGDTPLQCSFYEAIMKQELASPNSIRNAAYQTWKSTISKLESQYDASFAGAYATRALARLQLYDKAVSALEIGKLKNELTELLNGYLADNFLSETLRAIADRDSLRPCGRHVPTALVRLEGILRTNAKDPVEQPPGAERLATIMSVYQKEGSKLKAPQINIEQLKEVKKSMTEDALASARNGKSDADGSRAFLCVVLALWADRNDGFVYATGRFVPRLLKTLKGKMDDGMYERLQELKDVVKGGRMTDDQRQELLNMAHTNAQA